MQPSASRLIRRPVLPSLVYSTVSPPSGVGGGAVVGERGGQIAQGVELPLEVGDTLLRRLDRVGAGDEPARGPLLGGDGQQRLGELGRVAGLAAVLALPELVLVDVALRVVRD